LCMDWAIERRKIFGITLEENLEPRERLGKLRCTLEAVREEGEGASYGTASQNFPEVYTATNLVIHRAWQGMRPIWKEVMHVHYVWREIPVKVCAAEIGLEVVRYSEVLEKLKADLSGYLRSRKDVAEEA
jgi:hypothetical protein